MKQQSITNRAEYLGAIPLKLGIPRNTKFTVIVDSIDNSEINIAAACDITIIAVLTKGWKGTRKLIFNLNGEQTTLKFIAIIIGKNKERFSLKTTSNHNSPQTKAEYYLRSAMFDQSQVDYQGNLLIKAQAQQSEAYLAHHSLMLSEDSQTYSKPYLEIEADDVKAGHAVTVGRVNENLLFYLKSRGLDENQAQDLMIKGFLESELSKIETPKIQESIIQTIEKQLDAQP